MDKRSIGSLQVSVVGLGCNNFGTRIDEAQSKSVIDACLESGINFFDTADMYGSGKSEEFLGRGLGARRKDVIIATKFGHLFDGEKTGASPAHVRRACDASLARLGTDYIDLYQLHTPDPDVPIGETLGALNELVVAGKVLEIGCSNFDLSLLNEAETETKPGAARFVSVQNHLSLIHQGEESGVLDYCNQKSVGYLPFFPLACGLLTGKYRAGKPLPEGTRIKEGSDWINSRNLEVAEKLNQYAESKGQTILELAVSWLLSWPAVSSVIAGATKPEQVKANAASCGWVLSQEELREVAELTK